RRISVARVNVRAALALGPALHLLGARKRKIRGARNGYTHRRADSEFFLARVDRERSVAQTFCLRGFLHVRSSLTHFAAPSQAPIWFTVSPAAVGMSELDFLSQLFARV